MPSSAAYLFLELSIIVYVMGFGWEYWHTAQFCSRRFALAAIVLASIWFTLDQIALRLGLWTFPENGSLPIRFIGLPIEEYTLFFLHTFICSVLIGRYFQRDK